MFKRTTKRQVIRVYSTDNPERLFSIPVMESTDWEGLKAAIKRNLGLEGAIVLNVVKSPGTLEGILDLETTPIKALRTGTEIEVLRTDEPIQTAEEEEQTAEEEEPIPTEDEALETSSDSDSHIRVGLFDTGPPKKRKTRKKLAEMRARLLEMPFLAFTSGNESVLKSADGSNIEARMTKGLLPAKVEEAFLLNDHLEKLRIAIILCHGGYFAAGIFDGKGKCTHHKSFAHYVVRKSQGGRQGTLTQLGKKFGSAGSWKRRQEEKKLFVNVTSILKKWDFDSCTHLYIHGPGLINRQTLFGKGGLDEKDPRIRSILFPTRRPKFAEVQRVFRRLTFVSVPADWLLNATGKNHLPLATDASEEKEEATTPVQE